MIWASSQTNRKNAALFAFFACKCFKICLPELIKKFFVTITKYVANNSICFTEIMFTFIQFTLWTYAKAILTNKTTSHSSCA